MGTSGVPATLLQLNSLIMDLREQQMVHLLGFCSHIWHAMKHLALDWPSPCCCDHWRDRTSGWKHIVCDSASEAGGIFEVMQMSCMTISILIYWLCHCITFGIKLYWVRLGLASSTIGKAYAGVQVSPQAPVWVSAATLPIQLPVYGRKAAEDSPKPQQPGGRPKGTSWLQTGTPQALVAIITECELIITLLLEKQKFFFNSSIKYQFLFSLNPSLPPKTGSNTLLFEQISAEYKRRFLKFNVHPEMIWRE